MSHSMDCAVQLTNQESPFTELFSVLKRYEILPQGLFTLAYKTDELKVMHQHIDNAMDILLQGLQDLGQIVGHVAQDDKDMREDIKNIGYLIATISNLTEALNTLRADTNYVLEQRNEINNEL